MVQQGVNKVDFDEIFPLATEVVRGSLIALGYLSRAVGEDNCRVGGVHSVGYIGCGARDLSASFFPIPPEKECKKAGDKNKPENDKRGAMKAQESAVLGLACT